MLDGISPADEGLIELNGTAIHRAAPATICHKGIARTFQFNAGFDTLTARENVLVSAHFGRRNRVWPGLAHDRATRELADHALDLVGMTDRADETVKDLPIFYRKLLMMASAMATEPRLLLMDEPVGGLNPDEIDRMMEIVRGLSAQGVTIILIEHVMRFLVQLSDRVLIMHHGESIYEGSPQGLTRDARVIEVYLGEGMAKRLRHAMAGGDSDE